VRQVDRVLQDVGLLLERRRDVDRGVGDDEAALMARHVHHEAVAYPARGAQAGIALHHRGHQLVGVQAPLHQRLGLALAHELHRGLRRGDAVRRVDDRDAGEVDAALLGDRADARRGADQERDDQAHLRRRHRALERRRVARMRHRRRRRRQGLAGVDQALVFLVLAGGHVLLSQRRPRGPAG
jgi:hypothetical protein